MSVQIVDFIILIPITQRLEQSKLSNQNCKGWVWLVFILGWIEVHATFFKIRVDPTQPEFLVLLKYILQLINTILHTYYYELF